MYFSAIEYVDIVGCSYTGEGVYNQNIIGENDDFQPLYTPKYFANGSLCNTASYY